MRSVTMTKPKLLAAVALTGLVIGAGSFSIVAFVLAPPAEEAPKLMISGEHPTALDALPAASASETPSALAH